MSEPFFVMVHRQRGDGVMPLEDDNENVAMFETQEEALEAANSNHFATCFGFDVFQVGFGIEGGDGL